MPPTSPPPPTYKPAPKPLNDVLLADTKPVFLRNHGLILLRTFTCILVQGAAAPNTAQ